MKIESATQNKETGEHTYLIRDEKHLIQLIHTRFGWQSVQLNGTEGIISPERVREMQDNIEKIWEELDKEGKKEYKNVHE